MMNDERQIKMAALTVALLTGAFLIVWMFTLKDTVPAEYRSASPGFNWSWDFDYATALKGAARPGAKPWPWPATQIGSRIVLPVDQPLHTDGLGLTYRGVTASGRFRLDVVIENLDAGFSYLLDFDPDKARQGFMIGDRRFSLEKITPIYIRLRLDSH